MNKNVIIAGIAAAVAAVFFVRMRQVASQLPTAAFKVGARVGSTTTYLGQAGTWVFFITGASFTSGKWVYSGAKPGGGTASWDGSQIFAVKATTPPLGWNPQKVTTTPPPVKTPPPINVDGHIATPPDPLPPPYTGAKNKYVRGDLLGYDLIIRNPNYGGQTIMTVDDSGNSISVADPAYINLSGTYVFAVTEIVSAGGASAGQGYLYAAPGLYGGNGYFEESEVHPVPKNTPPGFNSPRIRG